MQTRTRLWKYFYLRSIIITYTRAYEGCNSKISKHFMSGGGGERQELMDSIDNYN